MGAFSYFQDKYFGKKLKESVSSTSCGTGIIIALPQNSSLSQRSIKHSSYDKGKPIDGSLSQRSIKHSSHHWWTNSAHQESSYLRQLHVLSLSPCPLFWIHAAKY